MHGRSATIAFVAVACNPPFAELAANATDDASAAPNCAREDDVGTLEHCDRAYAACLRQVAKNVRSCRGGCAETECTSRCDVGGVGQAELCRDERSGCDR